ncbi:MAG: hypothetical protein SGBAC_003460 [Bacillariaceae sp.]
MNGEAEKEDEPNTSVEVQPSTKPGPLLTTKSRSGMIVTVQTEGDSGETNEKDSDSDQPIDWSINDFDATNRSWKREILDSINTIRFNVGMLVNNSRIQVLIVVLIVANAIMMGIGTYDMVKKNPKVDATFEMVDQVFLIIFTVELCLQFIYLGWRLPFDGWLLFDLIIIVTSWSFASVQIIRAFRIFRALRLVTRIKIMKNLLLALFGVMPRMAAIGLMLCLILYIFAVMCTQLFKDLHVNGHTQFDYFGNMFATLLTLVQMMTLDGWAGIAREVMDVHYWAWIPIVAYVIVSGFVVVNLIIAVICDAISALNSDDKKMLEGNYEEDSDLDSNSQGLEIRAQLDSLEQQMEDLTRIQSRSFHALQYLTKQIEARKSYDAEMKKDI